MQHVVVTEELFDEIHDVVSKEAKRMGNLHGSIENGDGNYAGLFGEVLFTTVFDGERDNTYDYDVHRDDRTIDVKTKRRSVRPEPYYDCSISDYNTEQECDAYYFVSVQYDYSEASLLGYLPTDEYYDVAEFREEGDVDPDNGFEFKADCWNVSIEDLRQFDVVDEMDTEIEPDPAAVPEDGSFGPQP